MQAFQPEKCLKYEFAAGRAISEHLADLCDSGKRNALPSSRDVVANVP